MSKHKIWAHVPHVYFSSVVFNKDFFRSPATPRISKQVNLLHYHWIYFHYLSITIIAPLDTEYTITPPVFPITISAPIAMPSYLHPYQTHKHYHCLLLTATCHGSSQPRWYLKAQLQIPSCTTSSITTSFLLNVRFFPYFSAPLLC